MSDKFKVGDKVKIIKDYPYTRLGMTGVITKIINSTAYVFSEQWESCRVGDGSWMIDINHIKLLNSVIIRERLGIK